MPQSKQPNSDSSLFERPVPRVARVDVGQKRVATVNRKTAATPASTKATFPIDEELLKASVANLNEEGTRQRFRNIAIMAANAIGACHLQLQGQEWTIATGHGTGRVPSSFDIDKVLQKICNQAVGSHSLQTVKLPTLDDKTGLLIPIRSPAGDAELFMLVVKKRTEVAKATQIGMKISATMQLWMKANYANETHWQANSLAAIIEMVGKIEQCQTIKDAAEEIVNEFATRLDCSYVGLALKKGKKLKLISVSGVHKLDKESNTSRAYLQAMQESLVRGEQGQFPATENENNHLLLAHKQLSSQINCQSILSQPLRTTAGNEIGVWIFAGEQETLSNPSTHRFVKAATPHISASLELLQRNQRGRVYRAYRFVKDKISLLIKLAIPAIAIGFCFLMMMPVTYKVRCHCKVEPVSRRFAVAPFDGLIVTGHAKPGDRVTEGELLAEIDGRTIRWELSGVTAERRQSLRQREIKLSEGNIPETFLSELENERLTSEEKILQFKKDHLQIRSPISGVVLSGSLERAEASSVKTGEILFEVGPTDSMKVEIAIPSEDILQVKPGHEVTIWIEGQEDLPLKSKIGRIHPRSETRDAKNIYIAELEFDNPDDRLRPGMSGAVRIDCEQKTLGWTLFHKPINHLRARLTWW